MCFYREQMTWSAGVWSLTYCCSWGCRHASCLGMHLKTSVSHVTFWREPSPRPLLTILAAAPPSAGLVLDCSWAVDRSFTFPTSTLITALEATSVYSAGVWAPLLLSSNAPRLFYLLLRHVCGHYR